MHGPRVPVATYRLQFHRGFRFGDARALVPYLDALGVSDLYASPLLAARRGSTHGYDVTDPTRLNPELGTEEDFASLTGALRARGMGLLLDLVPNLRARGMGLLLDLVPNHMAASEENPWWRDVLAHGRASPFAPFFDIDWHPPDGSPANKVLLPILGGPYRSVLENGELTVGLEEQGFCLRYHDRRLPLAPRSWGRILAHRLEDLEAALGALHPAVRGVRDLLAALERLPAAGSPGAGAERGGEWGRPALARRLWNLYRGHAEIRAFLDETLGILGGKRGDREGLALLDRLLREQAYRLCFWREGNEAINYRRFFAVSDLVGLRVEEPAVFEATHALPFRLVGEKQVTGFRVDHVDGLLDPLGYLRRLQEQCLPAGAGGGPEGLYVVVEKILCGDEA
ncbi:MAG: malto-oligosyltrehalose synthase, partial [candidate division NC10 bacterium]|nr:malto-oligosyltrehalose synthase [candidate division NC10 bacterium]